MKNMTKQGGATYGPDGQSSTLPCRAWGLTPEARDCKVIIVALKVWQKWHNLVVGNVLAHAAHEWPEIIFLELPHPYI